jgi:hypothetical protein
VETGPGANFFSIIITQRLRKTTKRGSPAEIRTESLLNVFLCTVMLDYCPRQFTWRLSYVVVVLVWLVTSRSTQRDGKSRIHLSKYIIRGNIRSTVLGRQY